MAHSRVYYFIGYRHRSFVGKFIWEIQEIHEIQTRNWTRN